MIQIKYPFVLIVLLLPYLIYYFWPLREPNRKPIQLPSIPLVKNRSPRISLVLVGICVLSYICLALAACRPVFIGSPVLVKKDSYNIMVAVDVSPSMDMNDMVHHGIRTTRMDVLKEELKDFAASRKEDGFGLIVFADNAFVMSPVTHDHRLYSQFVDELATNLAGNLTSLGDAVILAGQTLASEKNANNVLILLTDGRDTSSRISADDAVTFALNNGMKIYTVGYGAMNNLVTEQMDTEMLQKLAEETGGRFFRATDPESLSQAYYNISASEPRLTSERYFQQVHELYYIPLLLSLLLSFAAAYLMRRHYE